jgi:hypothetical protein
MDVISANRVRTHLENCKQSACRYLDRGDVGQAWAAFMTEIQKAPITERDRELLFDGTSRLLAGELTDVASMRRFIEGF